MASSSNVVKTIHPPTDDYFLCRAFATAIASDKLLRVIEQQPKPTVELNVSSTDPVDTANDSPAPSESSQWKVGDLCLCPYSEDGLMYRATVISIDSTSCTVSFDDYGNEEMHSLTDLQIRIEDDQSETLPSIEEHDATVEIVPPPAPPSPPFPVLNSNEDNDTLSATLMSWYLAGYHTGFYQGLKNT